MLFDNRPLDNSVEAQIDRAEFEAHRHLKISKIIGVITAVLFVCGIISDILVVSKQMSWTDIIIGDAMYLGTGILLSGIFWLSSRAAQKRADYIREKNSLK